MYRVTIQLNERHYDVLAALARSQGLCTEAYVGKLLEREVIAAVDAAGARMLMPPGELRPLGRQDAIELRLHRVFDG